MAGNNTMSTLLSELRNILNEPSAGFWTDSQLQTYLKRAHRKYYERWLSFAPARNTRELSVTYTGGSRYVDLSADPAIGKIVKVEDRTNATSSSSGAEISPAGSLDDLLRLSYGEVDFSYYTGTNVFPAVYWLEEAETDSSGTKTITQRFWLAPVPNGNRSILIRYQPVPSNFSSSSHTTGLPERVEECVILQAAIYARLQEENPQGMAALKTMLQDAEAEMIRNSRTTRGPSRITYRSVD